MKDLLFFSNNKNKILEVSHLFSKIDKKILSLDDFKKIDSPEETGKTFKENSKIKSLYGLNNFKLACFADDSGICIESMNGNPGVNSKEFLLSYKNKLNIFNNIINICKKKKNFNAYFQTTIFLSLNARNNFFISV